MTPVKTLGTKAITKAQRLVSFVPSTGMKGEKAKDKTEGAVVLITILKIPKVNPKRLQSVVLE